MSAPYDEIADWYEDEFLSDRSEDGLSMSDPSVSMVPCPKCWVKVSEHLLRSAVALEHMLLGFVVWAGHPSALTSRPGCFDTLEPGFQLRGPMVIARPLGMLRSRVR